MLAYGPDGEPELGYLRTGNRPGVAAGICGLVALVLSWIPFVDYTSLVLGALAIILAILGLPPCEDRSRRGQGDGDHRFDLRHRGVRDRRHLPAADLRAAVTTINVAGG